MSQRTFHKPPKINRNTGINDFNQVLLTSIESNSSNRQIASHYTQYRSDVMGQMSSRNMKNLQSSQDSRQPLQFSKHRFSQQPSVESHLPSMSMTRSLGSSQESRAEQVQRAITAGKVVGLMNRTDRKSCYERKRLNADKTCKASAELASESQMIGISVDSKQFNLRAQQRSPLSPTASTRRAQVSPQQQIKALIDNIIEFRGQSSVKSSIKQYDEELSLSILKQHYRQNHMLATASKVEHFTGQRPVLLDWLFKEDKETQFENLKMQKQAVLNFELRKLDTGYLKMVEDQAKKIRKREHDLVLKRR